jgi:hypothetical protein
VELDTARPLVRRRATGSCEGCGLVTDQLDVHHRQARGAGGVHGDAAQVANDVRNLLALCRPCHDRTEDAEEWHTCLAMGWRVLHSHQHDVRHVPALLHTPQGPGWWMLTDWAGYVGVDWPRDRLLVPADLQGQTWLADLYDPDSVPSLTRR